jgi:hypothetical protein
VTQFFQIAGRPAAYYISPGSVLHVLATIARYPLDEHPGYRNEAFYRHANILKPLIDPIVHSGFDAQLDIIVIRCHFSNVSIFRLIKHTSTTAEADETL